ncbi:hypothetical protein AAC387_Pa07g1659 [Persea americana]
MTLILSLFNFRPTFLWGAHFPLRLPNLHLDLHRSSEVIQIFDGNNDGATKSKKPVWNVPAKGIIEVHPVMGASWPALSESTKATSISYIVTMISFT